MRLALFRFGATCLLLAGCSGDPVDEGDLGQLDAGIPTPEASVAATFDAGALGTGPDVAAEASWDGAVHGMDAAMGAGPSPLDASGDARGLDAAPGHADASGDASQPSAADAGRVDAQVAAAPPPFARVYRIALRVHRGDSGLSANQVATVLEEVNHIWWTQAAVCFEAEITSDAAPRKDGFDLSFHRSTLGCETKANGVYCGDHDVHTLDMPSLGAADNAQWDTGQNAARTSAHELGHGLRLEHYNGFADSNDSLMSSGRQGFKLHDTEISTARARAAQVALPDTSPAFCAAPML
jgi:hypothetical protein